MQLKVIGIVGAGDMGSGVGRALKADGYDVITSLERRSDHTRRLAAAAGMRDVGSIEQLVAEADLVLSIVPPAAAPEVADAVLGAIAALGQPVPFAECNAISPERLQKIAANFSAHALTLVDVGIVGRPPRPQAGYATRFYVSGPQREPFLRLAATGLRIIDMGPELGAASAIKMVYASLNKGVDALLTTVLLAADRLGVREALLTELAGSQEILLERMRNRIPYLAATAERYAPEMREIASTFESAAVTPDFHHGAEWLYALLAESPLAEETRATLPADRSLDAALDAFVAVLAGRARQ